MGRRKGITKLTALKRRLREGFDKRSREYIDYINEAIDAAASTDVLVDLEVGEDDQAPLAELLVGAGFDVMFTPDNKIRLSEPTKWESFNDSVKDEAPKVDGCTDVASELPDGDVAEEVAPF